MTISSTSGLIPSGSVTSSSIDVASIVGQLMQVESQPMTQLQNEQSGFKSTITALNTVQGAVSSFQTAVQGLTSLGQYQSYTTSSSNSAVSATASTSAIPGSYSVSVSQLAQAQSLVAAGQTSETAPIGTGATTTLNFTLGTISGGTLSSGVYSGATFTPNGGGTKSVTINSSNDSLSGIASAINAAGIGVTATVVNNGSSTPYQLVLTGPSGVSNSMQISVSGDATLSSLLSYNPAGTQDLTQVSAAQNAQLTVNGIALSQASNTVSNAVQGLTFNLTGTTASPATVSVAQNTGAVTTAVNNLVSAYNALNTAIQGVASYNSSTNTAGPLFGDPMVNNIQNQIRSILNTPISGTTSVYSTLAEIGVTFQQDGSMAVNSSQLNTALATSPSDIASLFSTVGKATDSLVQYANSSTSTQPGTYAVNVSQVATQGQLTGSVAPTLTITAGSNDTVNLNVDGNSVAVTLPAGTYSSASALATQLESSINGNSTLSAAGVSVGVTVNASGYLNLTSNIYGSASSVAVTGGDGSSGLLGSAPVRTNGLDVAGSINGAAATGSGQLLTSTAGNSSGLSLTIAGGNTGSRGTVSFSQGYAVSLNNLATSLLDPISGPIAAEVSGLNSSISNIGSQITNWQSRLASIQQSLTTQYTALNVMLGTMSQTSSYLSTQLAQLR
ncbi:flagellar filament capping protein FliD [Ferrovum sp.]|uniref:flagellar filament capping protein FliD n=1 Tax=Ferrovum sp. TaxID=2609467 RepID=UPI002630CF02|nr:flagellar filament capping protein FliD [Ferrovum sp.]